VIRLRVINMDHCPALEKLTAKAVGDAFAVLDGPFVLGVDPGRYGAIAIVQVGGGAAASLPMPVARVDRTERTDPWALSRLFRGPLGAARYIVIERTEMRDYVSRPRVRVGGITQGYWEMILPAHDLTGTIVPCGQWQRTVLGLTRSKKDRGLSRAEVKSISLSRAKALFPRLSDALDAVKNKEARGGHADALCIAEYARRSLGLNPESIDESRRLD